jgi:LAS superfamily LD-carboxypeptidase LdcB
MDMKKFMIKHFVGTHSQHIVAILTLVLFGVVGYFLFNLSAEIRSLKNDFTSTTANFEKRLTAVQTDLTTATRIGQDLSQKVSVQQNKSESLDQTLSGIASTVGTLEKLSKTDKELLQKYSKVYFLNENYVPLRLSTIDPTFLYDKTKTLQFHSLAMTFLTHMLTDSSNSNSTSLVVSAYRSFGTQASLKSSYTVTYGSGANKFSSDQGYSEHQLGTAVDLGTPYPDTLLSISFENTQAFKWLNSNAYRYGFILSYPKNNAYYQYEPWHWRFVGVQLATYLHNQNKNFYDLDQREIASYLATIFD